MLDKYTHNEPEFQSLYRNSVGIGTMFGSFPTNLLSSSSGWVPLKAPNSLPSSAIAASKPQGPLCSVLDTGGACAHTAKASLIDSVWSGLPIPGIGGRPGGNLWSPQNFILSSITVEVFTVIVSPRSNGAPWLNVGVSYRLSLKVNIEDTGSEIERCDGWDESPGVDPVFSWSGLYLVCCVYCCGAV
jgi:hypothetical protein